LKSVQNGRSAPAVCLSAFSGIETTREGPTGLSISPTTLLDRLPFTQPENNDATVRTADIKHHPQSVRVLDHQIMILASKADAFQSEWKLPADFGSKDQVRG
jgi:hypothetical protein